MARSNTALAPKFKAQILSLSNSINAICKSIESDSASTESTLTALKYFSRDVQSLIDDIMWKEESRLLTKQRLINMIIERIPTQKQMKDECCQKAGICRATLNKLYNSKQRCNISNNTIRSLCNIFDLRSYYNDYIQTYYR